MPLVPVPNYKPFQFLEQEMHMNVDDDDNNNNGVVVVGDNDNIFVVVVSD
jgi:hypothetical protein